MKTSRFTQSSFSAISVAVAVLCALCISGLLYAEYKRGAYDRTLLFSVEYDKDYLPTNRAYKIIRSIDKETHVAVFNMDAFTFYIDQDNTSEDDIDMVYSYDPRDRNSLKRIENPFKTGEFQKFKEEIIRSGRSTDISTYSYPGMDDFMALAEKQKYTAMKSDTGFVVQLKDPDTNRVKASFGVDAAKGSLVVRNNYEYSAGRWNDAEIIYPVYAKNSQDPTIKKLTAEASNKLGELLKGRK